MYSCHNGNLIESKDVVDRHNVEKDGRNGEYLVGSPGKHPTWPVVYSPLGQLGHDSR